MRRLMKLSGVVLFFCQWNSANSSGEIITLGPEDEGVPAMVAEGGKGQPSVVFDAGDDALAHPSGILNRAVILLPRQDRERLLDMVQPIGLEQLREEVISLIKQCIALSVRTQYPQMMQGNDNRCLVVTLMAGGHGDDGKVTLRVPLQELRQLQLLTGEQIVDQFVELSRHIAVASGARLDELLLHFQQQLE
ncbi:MAG: hypothetical protein LBF72_00745 [Holosporales bacterium]|jgi:hypothetical protein|nr:hypothetical protein [Holosporales bacterium]